MTRRCTGSAAMALLLCGCLVSGCQDEQSATTQPSENRITVTTAAVKQEQIRETVSGTGAVRAIRQVELRPEVSGIITALRFEEGQHVDQGDLLVRIDDAELQRRRAAREAALEAARADLTNAEWNLERISELRQSGTAAVEELKNARDEFRAAAATVDQLAAELRVIDEQLEDTRLRAPLAGRVTEQLVDVGDFVDVGDRITTVYQVDPLELAFWLPARAAPSVAPGQAVEVTAPARPDRTFDGELVFVSPAVNPQTRQFLVKARLSNPDGALKPGVFARGTVITATRELPVVPEECLVNLRNRHVVFEVTEGTAQLREVDIALRQPGRVALRGNIAPGDQVVRTGHMRLTDGAAVRVEPSAGTTRPSTQRSSPRAADAEAPP